MNTAKKDSRGRVLRSGEAQREDGRYMYRYTDSGGTRRTVYSWRLVSTDKLPPGKAECKALRDMEKTIRRDLEDGIKSYEAGGTCVNDLFDSFMELRQDLRPATRANYVCLYNKHVRDGFGIKCMNNIKPTDVKKFYLSLGKEKGLARSTIEKLNAILLQLFNNAVMDGLLRTNPASNVLPTLKDFAREKRRRAAMTEEEQEAFLRYVKNSDTYMRLAPLFIVLLGTGMRIGEALGLQWSSCDFDKNLITVDHTIAYKMDEDGTFRYLIGKPKTKAGARTIPMLSDVRRALLEEKVRSKPSKESFCVDGYTDFIFLNNNGKVFSNSYIYDAIQSIVTDYNREEAFAAAHEKRQPLLLPKLSAHIFRHTFCTRLCENKTDIQDIKIIQDVMGHKNIRVTMDIYNDVSQARKVKSFQDLEGRIKLA